MCIKPPWRCRHCREEDRARALPSAWHALGESLAWSDFFGHRQQVVAGYLPRHVGVDLLDVPVGFLHQLILCLTPRDMAAVAVDQVSHCSFFCWYLSRPSQIVTCGLWR